MLLTFLYWALRPRRLGFGTHWQVLARFLGPVQGVVRLARDDSRRCKSRSLTAGNCYRELLYCIEFCVFYIENMNYHSFVSIQPTSGTWMCQTYTAGLLRRRSVSPMANICPLTTSQWVISKLLTKEGWKMSSTISRGVFLACVSGELTCRKPTISLVKVTICACGLSVRPVSESALMDRIARHFPSPTGGPASPVKVISDSFHLG